MRWFLLVVIVSVPAVAQAQSTHWVSPTGAAANWAACESASPLSGASACSLTTFRTRSSDAAGDIVYFRDGAYTYNSASNLIVPTTSGTANAKITFRAYQSEVPVITNINAATSFYEAQLDAKDYIVIRGLTFVDFPRHIRLYNGSDYNEIAYNDISLAAASVSGTVPRGVQVYNNGGNPSTHNWIHHNTIHGLYSAPCAEGGDGIMIGDTGSNLDSNYNTVEYNTFYNIGHAFTDNFTQYNVFRGNFGYNPGFKTFTANLTGTATGGSSTTMVDTSKNFSSLGVTTGTFIYVHDLSDPGSGSAKRALVTSLSTTTNPNDTLNYSSGTGTPTFANGHSYSIGCAYFADTNPPGDGKYAHRGFHLDTQSGQRISAFADSILFEGNRSGYASSNPGNDGSEDLAVSAGRVIVRYNDFYGAAGPGLYFKNGIVSSNNRVYNNTIYGNGRFLGTQFPSNPITTTGIQIGTAASVNNKLFNNIIYGNGGGDFNTSIPGSWTTTTNHLAANGDPLVQDATLLLGGYASPTLPNLNLQATSAAINAGSALTTTVATSSGTTLVVADATFFQDGSWGSELSDIQPDCLAVGTVSNTVCIASIDYATNTITLATSTSWTSGASVWLYKKSDGEVVLVGSAPDIGAHEYPTLAIGTSGSPYGGTRSRFHH